MHGEKMQAWTLQTVRSHRSNAPENARCPCREAYAHKPSASGAVRDAPICRASITDGIPLYAIGVASAWLSQLAAHAFGLGRETHSVALRDASRPVHAP